MEKEQLGPGGFPCGCFLQSQICWWSPAPPRTGRGSGASAGAGSVLGQCFVPPLGLPEQGWWRMEVRRGARLAQRGGSRKNLLGQSQPGLHPGHSHAGCCRSIHLYPSDPAPTQGAEHKAPLDWGWGSSARPESLCVVCDRDGQRVPASPACCGHWWCPVLGRAVAVPAAVLPGGPCQQKVCCPGPSLRPSLLDAVIYWSLAGLPALGEGLVCSKERSKRREKQRTELKCCRLRRQD